MLDRVDRALIEAGAETPQQVHVANRPVAAHDDLELDVAVDAAQPGVLGVVRLHLAEKGRRRDAAAGPIGPATRAASGARPDPGTVSFAKARAFAGPALGALAPNLVPRDILPRAIALSSIAWQSGAIAGPALGGYLYAWAPAAPYAASALLFMISLAGLFAIGPVARPEFARGPNPWKQMVDGLHYVRRNRLVLGAISLDLFAVLLGGATAMLPVFARDVLHAGPEGLGHLRAAPAVGATLTAAFFSFRPLKHNVGTKMLTAVGVFGAATIIFGFSRWMPLSLFCLALLGSADMFSVYVRQSLIQLYTPDEMRGRVGAVSSLFISASNELGEAESGFLGALIGPVPAVIAGGIGAIAVVFLWSWWFPELRLAKSFEPPDLRELQTEESKA